MQRVLDDVDILNSGVRNVPFRTGEHPVTDHELVFTEVVPEDDVLNHRAGRRRDDDQCRPQLVVASARGEEEQNQRDDEALCGLGAGKEP